MKEIHGNLWDATEDYIIITTNGIVKGDGACVMGRGVALQAKDKYPNIPYELGNLITERGNNLHVLSHNLISFPVKDHWKEQAKIKIISRSMTQLKHFADRNPSFSFAMPRPGCGNGRLSWAVVKRVLDSLDDRFVIDNR